MLADKAYDADRIWFAHREKGAFANIPPRSDHARNLTSARGSIARGGIATRYDKLADKAYDADRIRLAHREKGAFAEIQPRSGRRSKPYFSTWLYREGTLIERFFSRPKHFRGIATRYDKLAEPFLAMAKLASIRLWFPRLWVYGLSLVPPPLQPSCRSAACCLH